MRYLKYFSILIFSMLLLNSCFEESDKGIDLNDKGNNVAAFTNAKENLAAIADGNEYIFNVKVKVHGPTSMDLTGDVTMTIAAHESSSAIEGTHYRLDTPTVTLTKANNYLGTVAVTMITDGIDAPLASSPVLVIEAIATTGDGVVPAGKLVEATLNYACYSNLGGGYTVTVLRDGGPITPYSAVTIAETGIGEYRTSEVGHWPQSSLGGTPGYTFYDVCGVLSIPGQNLVDLYSNWVEGTQNGSADPETGELHLVYKISSTWESEYDCTYVPN
jgi:hypothetical protein